MKEIKVVIGKNFGDEGKGQTVSDLCRGTSALVVRHNGGAQAGHTVEEGRSRFVFHQIGSGSLWGAPTYWNHSFLPDLLKLGEEAQEFERTVSKEKAMTDSLPTIYAHPKCACTVIYDVLLNSLAETLRGEKKHGSCGMGIYEAVLRSRREEYRICLREFAATAKDRISREQRTRKIMEKMRLIRQEYATERLEQLRGEFVHRWQEREIQNWIDLIWDDNVLLNTVEEMCENYDRYVRLADMRELWQQYDRIVFENAQGLLLDEDNREYYPHLTPSHTGLHNVVSMLEELSGKWLQEILKGPTEKHYTEALPMEIIYVTRTYVTRHGAGRLDCECAKEDICPFMEDKTNVPNPWQDSLRYAKHPSVEEFFRPVLQDLKLLQGNSIGEKLTVKTAIRLTHLDETDRKILFADGKKTVREMEELISDFFDGSLTLLYG